MGFFRSISQKQVSTERSKELVSLLYSCNFVLLSDTLLTILFCHAYICCTLRSCSVDDGPFRRGPSARQYKL